MGRSKHRSTDAVQSRFAETLTLTLTLNPNFGESGFGESGRHHRCPLTDCGINISHDAPR